MSKGDGVRPRAISKAEWDQRHEATFGKPAIVIHWDGTAPSDPNEYQIIVSSSINNPPHTPTEP